MLRRIETIEFKREENAEWEMGLELNDGCLGVLDRFGKFVDEIWDIKDCCEFVIDHLDIILNQKALDKVRAEEFEKMKNKEDDDVKEYRKGHGITEDFSIDIKEVKQYRSIGYTL